jgi:hypothetical protein
VVTHAIKDVCRDHNRKMRPHVSASNEQRPANDSSRPYDVGILLDGAYLIGLEFKLQQDDEFPSWSQEQHEAYVALTGSERMGLPLFYAYNVAHVKRLVECYEKDAYVELLLSANVSTPQTLPGRFPSMPEHKNMHQWLTEWMADPNRSGKNGWNSIRVNDVVFLEDAITYFPNLIWLLAIVHEGMRVCWALTGDEVREHIANLRQIWKHKELRTLSKGEDIEAAYTLAISEIVEYIDRVQLDVENQQKNVTDMDDRPDHRSSGPSF